MRARGQRPIADNSRKLSSSINQVPNSYSLSQGKRKREGRGGGERERGEGESKPPRLCENKANSHVANDLHYSWLCSWMAAGQK